MGLQHKFHFLNKNHILHTLRKLNPTFFLAKCINFQKTVIYIQSHIQLQPFLAQLGMSLTLAVLGSPGNPTAVALLLPVFSLICGPGRGTWAGGAVQGAGSPSCRAGSRLPPLTSELGDQGAGSSSWGSWQTPLAHRQGGHREVGSGRIGPNYTFSDRFWTF